MPSTTPWAAESTFYQTKPDYKRKRTACDCLHMTCKPTLSSTPWRQFRIKTLNAESAFLAFSLPASTLSGSDNVLTENYGPLKSQYDRRVQGRDWGI